MAKGRSKTIGSPTQRVGSRNAEVQGGGCAEADLGLAERDSLSMGKQSQHHH